MRVGFPYGDSDPELAGYRIVWIQTDNGDEVGLFYVSPYDEDGNEWVKEGDRVEAGAIVGTMQNRAAISPGMENHFHLKVIQNREPVDQAPWLERWRREIQREDKWYGN